ncbi:Minor histocompatibility antigen H13 [Porphyridium purpureum]|uniref:Minor histocompatibility antigen H13 n=1 Tax=Porphyridium purpureum TaxID=35688 RepID=A0A5J4YQG2_PORPP|nr:Minor histocompatibility antigen H13 [Porphyridium purpureum]|eukprot:POR6293..scf236_6
MGALVREVGALVAVVALLAIPAVVNVPVFPQMVSVSMMVIYAGSERATRREQKRKEMGAEAEPREVISGSAAYRFPLAASLMLGGLFIAFKYLPQEWISPLLTFGSVFMGVLAMCGVLAALADSIEPRLMKQVGFSDTYSCSVSDILSFILCLPVGWAYVRYRHFLANNIMACSLALAAIEFLGIEDYKTGAILLAGLFVYDIFWVFGSTKLFGSNVMVTVAKGFEGPIKLLFRRSAGEFSMLGLGDVVLPGLFIALIWRFDERSGPCASLDPRKKPYFTTVMIGYFLAVVATYAALVLFDAAQPALLYIVPGILFSTLALAVARGEVGELIAYSEAETTKSDAHECGGSEKKAGDAIADQVVDSARTNEKEKAQ